MRNIRGKFRKKLNLTDDEAQGYYLVQQKPIVVDLLCNKCIISIYIFKINRQAERGQTVKSCNVDGDVPSDGEFTPTTKKGKVQIEHVDLS